MLPATYQNQLAPFIKAKPQSLLIQGTNAADTLSVCDYFLSKVGINLNPEQALTIEGEKPPSIEDIRSIQAFLKLKSRDSKNKKVVILSNCNSISIESQNALLKTLEEPAENSHIILLKSDSTKLLPTIRSRVAELSLHVLSSGEISDYIKQTIPNVSQDDLKLALFVCDGSPGLCLEILNNPIHPLREAALLAKTFIASTRYENLLNLAKIGTNRDEFLNFLKALKQILRLLIEQSTKQDNPKIFTQLSNRLKRVLEAETTASISGTQTKLIYLNLALTF